jgi:hypothetical protein
VAHHPEAAVARRIFLIIRSPHHYVPMSFLPDFAALFAWQALGLLALVVLARVDPVGRERLRALTVALFVLIGGATLSTTVVYVPAIAQLYVWRLAPFAVLVAQLAATAALAWRSAGVLPIAGRSLRVSALSVLVMGLAVLAWRADVRSRIALAVLGALALCGPAGVDAVTQLRARVPRAFRDVLRPAHVAGAIGLALFLVGVLSNLRGLADEVAFLSAPVLGEGPMFAWARSTPRDALFAVPPGLQEFRLATARSVVVDWKSTPVLPGELLEWYRRLLLISGLPEVQTLADVERGYAVMGPRRIDRLARELGVDFVLFRQPFPRARLGPYPVAFADRHYIAFGTRPRGRAAPAASSR